MGGGVEGGSCGGGGGVGGWRFVRLADVLAGVTPGMVVAQEEIFGSACV